MSDGAITTIGLALVAAFSHAVWTMFKTRENTDSIKDLKKLCDLVLKEQTKVEQALDRTYAPKEFCYTTFVTVSSHKESLERLEEKLMTELKHMNETLTRIASAVEKKGDL